MGGGEASAAVFWEQARQQGLPAADDRALDGNVVLAAQAITLRVTDMVIAAANVAHPSRIALTTLWPDITARSLMLAALARMARHEGPLMIAWPCLLRSPLHLDAWSDTGPGDRVAVGIDYEQAMSPHRAQQAGLEQRGWAAPMRAQRLACKGLGGLERRKGDATCRRLTSHQRMRLQFSTLPALSHGRPDERSIEDADAERW